ncbi:MAG: hypothetical protein WCW33_05155 [Candidatus Babeliales bacterium]|jgi:hypothetical protein
MFKKMLLSAFLAMSAVQLCAMQMEPCARDIDDIPKYCSVLADILSEQPSFVEHDYEVKKLLLCGPLVRVPEFKCIYEQSGFLLCGRICEFLSMNAQKFLENAWRIERGLGISTQYFTTEELRLLIPRGSNMCSLEELGAAYAEVIESLKKGWCYMARATDPSETAHNRSEAEELLFIKRRCLFEEDKLVELLSDQFIELKGNVHCQKDSENGDILFLWVKRSALSVFEKKFKFHITPDDYKVCTNQVEGIEVMVDE